MKDEINETIICDLSYFSSDRFRVDYKKLGFNIYEDLIKFKVIDKSYKWNVNYFLYKISNISELILFQNLNELK